MKERWGKRVFRMSRSVRSLGDSRCPWKKTYFFSNMRPIKAKKNDGCIMSKLSKYFYI